MSTSRRKPAGKAAAIQETQETGEPSTYQETPPAQPRDSALESQPIDLESTQNLEPRAYLNQGLSNITGSLVQLTEEQFQSLLVQLTAKDLRTSVPDTQEPLRSQPVDPDDSFSESSHRSYQGHHA